MKLFKGRMSRKDFFAAFIIYIGVLAYIFFVSVLPFELAYLAIIIVNILFLPFIVKRFHDLGVTGWLSIITLIPVPIISIILGTALMFQQGELKPNKHGPPPR